jgi:hypothetical protein
MRLRINSEAPTFSEAGGTAQARTAADSAAVRSVFVIVPQPR